MARVILVTGGSRSGKSGYALRLGESLPGPHWFIATCVPRDEEMRRRVRTHQAERERSRWRTVETSLGLAEEIRRRGGAGLILVECLALWVSNLMEAANERGHLLDERELIPSVDELLGSCEAVPAAVILVTVEVGLGVVPENRVARRYRDLLGLCNQMVARHADVVTLVACGLPLTLKGASDGPRRDDTGTHR